MGNLHRYVETIPAGDTFTAHVRHDYIRLLDGAGTFTYTNDRGDTLALRIGLGCPLPGIAKMLRLQNTTGSPVQVELAVGDGVRVDDNRSAIIGTVTVEGEHGADDGIALTTPTTITADTATEADAADADVAYRLLIADPGNTETIYIGPDNTVTAANGVPLNANDSIPWPGSGAVWAIDEGGGSQKLRNVRFEK